MARLSKQIKNRLVAYVNDREKGKKAGQAIMEFYTMNEEELKKYQDDVPVEEFIQKLYIAYRNEYFLKSVANNKKTKPISIEPDKEQLINELEETINKMNELYSKVKKMLSVWCWNKNMLAIVV